MSVIGGRADMKRIRRHFRFRPTSDIPGIGTFFSGLRVLLRTHDLDSDERFVTLDPCIVSRRDGVRHSRTDSDLRTIVHLDCYAAGHGITDMTDLAAVGVDGWLHAFRPSPPRLENETSDREAFKPNYFNSRFARGPALVRFVVRFGFKLFDIHTSCHG